MFVPPTLLTSLPGPDLSYDCNDRKAMQKKKYLVLVTKVMMMMARTHPEYDRGSQC